MHTRVRSERCASLPFLTPPLRPERRYAASDNTRRPTRPHACKTCACTSRTYEVAEAVSAGRRDLERYVLPARYPLPRPSLACTCAFTESSKICTNSELPQPSRAPECAQSDARHPPTRLSALACAEHALPRLQTFADATESFAHAHYTQNTHHPANPASRSPTRRPLPRARPLWRRKQRPAPARAARKHKSDNIRVIAICETNSRGPVAIRATGRAHFSAKRIPQVAA